MKCWICGSEANSSEHKFKKKDFKRLWGEGPYRGEATIAHVANGTMSNVHGPNSDRAKFSPCLCEECNNSFSQPFDLAYDEFIDWFELNKLDVYQKRVINWEDVYGDSFPEKQRNLYKYFAKCFGCRIANFGHQVPTDVIELLYKDYFETGLFVTFSINEDLKLLPEEDTGLGIHPLIYHPINDEGVNAYYCGYSYKWLDINYFYFFNTDMGLGAPWVANAQYVYLGYYFSLNDEQRNEFLEKIKNRTTTGFTRTPQTARVR